MTTYTESITIDRPLKEVLMLFKDTSRYKEWQPELEEFETFEGRPAEEGSKARIRKHAPKGAGIKMKQIVEKDNLPEEYVVKQDTDGVLAWNYFTFEGNNGQTQVHVKGEYDTDGFMKLVDFFNPSYFDKQLKEYLKSFKDFAEKRA